MPSHGHQNEEARVWISPRVPQLSPSSVHHPLENLPVWVMGGHSAFEEVRAAGCRLSVLRQVRVRKEESKETEDVF